MIKLFRRLAWAFLYDEAAAVRWIRGFLLWAGTMGVQVLAYPWSVVQAWSPGEWLWRLGCASLVGASGTVIGGEKNLTPEQLRAALDAVPWDGKDRRSPPAPGGTP